jgi:hypothetical protein
VLAPQAVDDFAGWRVLEAVRRDYATLPPGEALARVEAELRRAPDGPAAEALRGWLANESLREGALLEPHEVGAADAGWVAEGAERVARARRHAVVGAVGAAAALVFAVVAARGLPAAVRADPAGWRAPLRVGAAGFVLVGLLPVGAALVWEPPAALPMLLHALWAGTALLLARGAPVALGAVGAAGGFLALSAAQGWLTRMGVP